jgi:hypothetical protein
LQPVAFKALATCDRFLHVPRTFPYLEKHRAEIIDYGRRQRAGKPIGSGRMEKGVDQVIGARQKHKGMSWSPTGSKALGILKVVELNQQWDQLWFPQIGRC